MEINIIKENIYKSFKDTKPLNRDFKIINNNPKFIFRDESWEHIQNFAYDDSKYLWMEKHNTNYKRIKDKNGVIDIFSKRKKNNWNLFYYKNSCDNDFSFSFDILTKHKLSEIQLSFMCEDLRNRYRFMVRDNNCAVFETVYNGEFYRYIKRKNIEIDFVNIKHNVLVKRVSNNYQLYIDNELIFSICDNINLIKNGRDLALIIYNREDNDDVDCEISNIVLKNEKKYINKVGILTYHKAHNYGAYLQAISLCNRLNQEENINCEIIDYRSIKEKINYSIPNIKVISNNLNDTLLNYRRKVFYTNLFYSFEKSNK